MTWKEELEEVCGEEYQDAVETLIDTLITSLLKKQREICAEVAQTNTINRQAILNAPEPKGMPDKVREWDFTKSAPDE